MSPLARVHIPRELVGLQLPCGHHSPLANGASKWGSWWRGGGTTPVTD